MDLECCFANSTGLKTGQQSCRELECLTAAAALSNGKQIGTFLLDLCRAYKDENGSNYLLGQPLADTIPLRIFRMTLAKPRDFYI